MPVEMFIPEIDSSKVDYSTENWLQYLVQKINFKKWYCEHYHTNKHIWKIEFLFEKVVEFRGNN
jgi:3-oxoacid CoA-transferase subunit A